MRLGVKIFLLVFGLAFIVSGATGSYFYFSAKKSMFETIRQELMATAAAFAQTISGDELESLVDPKQMNSATYKEIQEVLWGITQTNDEFFYAYTMRLEMARFILLLILHLVMTMEMALLGRMNCLQQSMSHIQILLKHS